MSTRRRRRHPLLNSTKSSKIKPPAGLEVYQDNIRRALKIDPVRWKELEAMGRSGPKPIHACDMDHENKAELFHRVGNSTTSKLDHNRASIPLLRNAGMSMKAICDETGYSREIVRGYCKRFCEEGLEGLEDKPGRGRNPWISQAIVVAITRYICGFKAQRRRLKEEETQRMKAQKKVKQKEQLEDKEQQEEEEVVYPPYSRLSTTDIHEMLVRDFGAEAPCLSSVYRLLKRMPLRPWLHKNWIHITDRNFWELASVVLDLYCRRYEGEDLGENDFVLSLDEITQLQVLERLDTPATPGHRRRIGFKYYRHGVLMMHAARDVSTGVVHHRFVDESNSDEFKIFVKTLKGLKLYTTANRLFLIMDQGSCHHPSTFQKWLDEEFGEGKVIAIHTPANASWLNQIECFFSILVRKALTPRNFKTPDMMRKAINEFIVHYNERTKPFKWVFNKDDLRDLLERLRENGLYPYPRGPLEIEGVGLEKRKTLLDTFGSIESIRDATYEAILALPGFGPKLAKRVIDHLGDH